MTVPITALFGRNPFRGAFIAAAILSALLLAVSAFFAGCGSDDPSEDRDFATADNNPVYERFNLKDMYNKRHQWSNFLGKPFVINFWATWCGPCRREMPILKKLYDEYHPKGLEIIGISVDDARTRRLVAPFVEQYGVPWVILYGEEPVLKEFSLGPSIPTTLFFDAEGNEISRIVGAQPEVVFRRELAKLFPSSAQ